jgi:hypothetical protein
MNPKRNDGSNNSDDDSSSDDQIENTGIRSNLYSRYQQMELLSNRSQMSTGGKNRKL